MPFHTFGFILVFLPLVAGGYFAIAKVSGDYARAFLIAASLVFCAFGGAGSVAVLAASIAFNYAVSLRLGRDNPVSGRWLRFALWTNVLALCVFKYSAFAVTNLNAMAGTHWQTPALIQPLGISFFTVQQCMFLVDRHQGVTQRQRFSDYALFVSWFPYMIAGPITRWKEVVPQFRTEVNARVNWENVSRGTILFVLGLTKKVVLSDTFVKWVHAGFSAPGELGFAGAWVSVICYGAQLYLDFSGYTDMARGAARMMNIDLPENFDDPFRSRSIIDFWQHWHMTLTHFITNYLYTPILRSSGRPTLRKSMAATVAAMTIAGLWHGASWNYVIFGLWHGIGLAVNQAWRRSKRRIRGQVSWLITAVFVLIGFVFFRSATLSLAFSMLHAMFLPGIMIGKTFRQMVQDADALQAAGMIAALAVMCARRSAREVSEQVELRPRAALAVAACAWFAFVIMNSRTTVEFIYRQF
jgi:D-alanyl-lipoteichoic acid acyltransferase DltB (MBOAT superfamily)